MRKWGPPPSLRHWKEQHHGRLPWVAEDLGRHRAGGAAEGRHRCSMVLGIWIPTFARTKSPSYVGKELVNIPYIHGAYGISFHFPSPFSEWPEGDFHCKICKIRSFWKSLETRRGRARCQGRGGKCEAGKGGLWDFRGFQWISADFSGILSRIHLT